MILGCATKIAICYDIYKRHNNFVKLFILSPFYIKREYLSLHMLWQTKIQHTMSSVLGTLM